MTMEKSTKSTHAVISTQDPMAQSLRQDVISCVFGSQQDNRNFQIFLSTCSPCLQTKHAYYKGQALLLSHLTGQGGSCMDKM